MGMKASDGSSDGSSSAVVERRVVYVVLDGANVAFEKSLSSAKEFYNVQRLHSAIQFFDQLQPRTTATTVTIRCVAFAPNHWLNKKLVIGSPTSSNNKAKTNGAMETDDWTLLQQLVDQRKVVLTPSHAHDDFYVIDYAVKHDGFIVTNDMFRDHIANEREFQGQVLRESWIKTHCIDFTFVGDEFLPNARAIERVLHHQPAPQAVVVRPKRRYGRKTLQSRDEQEEMQEESMEIVSSSQARVHHQEVSMPSKTTTAHESDGEQDFKQSHHHVVVDADEMTPFKLPKRLFPMVFGEHGATLHEFEKFTNTSVIFPCMKRDQLAATFHQLPATVTLYIYGQEAHRMHAINTLRSFMMEQMQIQYHQQQVEIHQQHQQHANQPQYHHHHHHHHDQYSPHPQYSQPQPPPLPPHLHAPSSYEPSLASLPSQVDASGNGDSVQMMDIE